MGAQCGLCASALKLRAGRRLRAPSRGRGAPAPRASPQPRGPRQPKPSQQRFLPTLPAPPVQFRKLPRAGRWCLPRQRRLSCNTAPSSGRHSAKTPPAPNPQLPHAARLSIPARSYVPSGSAGLSSAAAARLLGPTEPWRQRGRGESGAPPWPPNENRAARAPSRAGKRGQRDRDPRARGRGGSPRPRNPSLRMRRQRAHCACRACRSARRRSWASVSDSRAAWGSSAQGSALQLQWVSQQLPPGAFDPTPGYAETPHSPEV